MSDEPTKPETDEAIPVEKLITTLPGAEPVWELIRRYEALREKPKPQPEADEAEMLKVLGDFCEIMENGISAFFQPPLITHSRDIELDQNRLSAIQWLLSRYQSQQERIKELEEACADLDEARIALFNELASLKASQEPPQNDFDYNSPPFQSAGKRTVQHKPEETQS